MKKKLLAIVLSLAMAAGLMACGGTQKDTKEKAKADTASSENVDNKEDIKIGMVTYMMAQEWYQNIVSGAQEKADSIGIDLMVADANNDASKQVEQVEETTLAAVG